MGSNTSGGIQVLLKTFPSIPVTFSVKHYYMIQRDSFSQIHSHPDSLKTKSSQRVCRRYTHEHADSPLTKTSTHDSPRGYDDYTESSGTSMAVATTASLALLIRSYRPKDNVDTVKTAIRLGSTLLGQDPQIMGTILNFIEPVRGESRYNPEFHRTSLQATFRSGGVPSSPSAGTSIAGVPDICIAGGLPTSASEGAKPAHRPSHPGPTSLCRPHSLCSNNSDSQEGEFNTGDFRSGGVSSLKAGDLHSTRTEVPYQDFASTRASVRPRSVSVRVPPIRCLLESCFRSCSAFLVLFLYLFLLLFLFLFPSLFLLRFLFLFVFLFPVSVSWPGRPRVRDARIRPRHYR